MKKYDSPAAGSGKTDPERKICPCQRTGSGIPWNAQCAGSGGIVA
ncbi:MAG: hypothetical protein ACLTXT_05955 [Ruminococcus callidus]